jgi:hypothetical protein
MPPVKSRRYSEDEEDNQKNVFERPGLDLKETGSVVHMSKGDNHERFRYTEVQGKS